MIPPTMKFEVLVLSTQSRSSGYHSKKHKLDVLQGLGLPMTQVSLSIYSFRVPIARIKEVELKLQSAHVEYRKALTR